MMYRPTVGSNCTLKSNPPGFHVSATPHHPQKHQPQQHQMKPIRQTLPQEKKYAEV